MGVSARACELVLQVAHHKIQIRQPLIETLPELCVDLASAMHQCCYTQNVGRGTSSMST